jgi:hypothetical protein
VHDSRCDRAIVSWEKKKENPRRSGGLVGFLLEGASPLHVVVLLLQYRKKNWKETQILKEKPSPEGQGFSLSTGQRFLSAFLSIPQTLFFCQGFFIR